jgi:hypothetical protein
MTSGHDFISFIRNHRLLRFAPYAALYVLLSLALAVILPEIYYKFAFEMEGPINWDTPLYFTVAQGILNGLIPYTDLFEPKPPGIYIIIAVSKLLFGSHILGNMIVALSLIIFPLIMICFTRAYGIGHNRPYLLVLAGILGGIFALYNALLTGSYQTEPIASVFGVIFILIAAYPTPINKWRIIAAAVFMLAAIGTREALLLTLFGSIFIIYANNPRELALRFFLPLFLAVILGVFILFCIGWLDAFFSDYLAVTQQETVFFKKLNIPAFDLDGISTRFERITRNLAWFSDYLPLFVFFLIAASMPIITGESQKHAKRQSIYTLAAIIVGTFIAIFVIGLTYYYSHHNGYIIPLYFSICITFIRNIANIRKEDICVNFCIVAAFIAVATIGHIQRPEYDFKLNGLKRQAGQAKREAFHIDKIMDVCGYERYLFVGKSGFKPYGYTKHSPLGPAFIQGMFFMDPEHKHLRKSILQNLKAAPLVYIDDLKILNDNNLAKRFERKLEANFSQEIPECASKTRSAKVLKNIYYKKPSSAGK